MVLTVEEKVALLRAKTPTGMRSPYEKVSYNHTTNMYDCMYVADDYPEVIYWYESLTTDERAKLCGFKSYEHMLMADDEYNEARRERAMEMAID